MPSPKKKKTIRATSSKSSSKLTPLSKEDLAILGLPSEHKPPEYDLSLEPKSKQFSGLGFLTEEDKVEEND